jgi:MoaA/NifB/PqqE/SkfB family radical SAM enzyme
MDDLKSFGVPVLILSGGEPLLRPDIYAVAHRAKAMGFYVGLSTNGTLIDRRNIGEIAGVGFDYVGISLDGTEATHDRFRRKQGAFMKSLAGVRLCRDAGIKVGLRFTLTQDNAHDLPALLDLMEAERVDKFYLSHLNYSGRGNINRKTDAVFQTTRRAMDLIFDTAWRHIEAGRPREFVTGNNDADGAYRCTAGAPRASRICAGFRAMWRQRPASISEYRCSRQRPPGHALWDYSLGNVRSACSQIWQICPTRCWRMKAMLARSRAAARARTTSAAATRRARLVAD